MDVTSNKSFLRSSPDEQEIDRLRTRLQRAEELLRETQSVLRKTGREDLVEAIDTYFGGHHDD